MNRSIATASLLVWISLASPAFSAEKAVQEAAVESRLAAASLAPPGLCAEPRAAAAGPAESYPVAVPVSSLFDPRDVAASPLEGLQQPGPPSARALVRPGSCDQPGAGCGASVATTAVEVPPVTPGVRPPRATR